MTDLEQRGINVIRGLALDAVEKAKSGHQGTALALAPLAHVLFTRIMRYDAATPDWPDRDRFVLSNGHVSALLYSMLHLTGFGLELGDLEQFRQWGSTHAGPPRVPAHRRRRGHHRPARSGHRQRRRDRARRGEPARAVRQRAHRPPHVRDRRRRLPLRGREPRGRVARRPPRARPPDRRLRRQPHHDRRPHRARAHRRRRAGASAPTAGTCSSSARSPTTSTPSRPASARPWPRPTGRASSCCARTSAGRRRSGPTPRRPTATRSPRTTSARSRSLLDLPPDEHFFVPDDVLAYYREAGTRGAPLVAEWRERLTRAARARSRARRRLRRVHRRHGQDRLGGEDPVVAGGRRPRHPRGVQGGARRDRRRRARPRRRRRRPHRQHRYGDPRRRRARARRARRPPGLLRRPRARHERGDERHVGERPAPVRRHVLRVLRLRPRRGAARGAERVQGRVRLVARLGRGRRGRPHAPAGRAARGDAGDARAAGDPPGRRQRDRGRVAHPHRRRRPDRADPLPAEAPGARGHHRRRDDRRRRRRVRAAARVRRRARRRARRHRLRGVAVRRRPPRRSPPTASSVRVVSMPCWELFEARDAGATGTRCCRPACPRSRSRPATSFGWDRYADATVDASTTSARRRPATSPCASSASRAEHVVERARALLASRRIDDDLEHRQAQRLRPGALVRQHHPRDGARGRPRGARARRRHPRRHVEPHDLREGDRRRRGLRRRHRRGQAGAATRSRTRSGTSRSTTSGAAPTSSGRCTTPSAGTTASSRSRCRRKLAHDTDAHDRAGQGALRPARPTRT